MRKSATLAEVAAQAGVSVITASRALRGQSHVAKATRKRILEAAEHLDYTPDLVAKTMRGARTRMLGVFLNGFATMVMHDLLAAIDVEARRLGYDLMVFNAESFDDGRAGPMDMMFKLCDGVLWLLPNVAHVLLERLEASRLPCVLVSFAARPTTLPVVIGANQFGARKLMQHLLDHGHRKIAFVTGTAATGQSQERQRGYEDALREAGIRVRLEYIVEGNFQPASGGLAARKLLALADRPTAIFCANDGMALAALKTAGELGYRVPRDLSVAGFDDVPAASMVTPRLTTVRQPLDEIGTRAVNELMRLIGGAASGPSKVELPTQLAVRESSGLVPSRT